MKTISSPRTSRGFTLIEMLVTITIIVILAGISVAGFKFVTSKQANEQAKIQVGLLSQALEEYKMDTGEYPLTGADPEGNTNLLFNALYQNGVQNPGTEKIYLSDLDPESRQGWIEGTGATAKIVDPWGVEYNYRSAKSTGGDPNQSFNPDFDLWSKGQDGSTSTTDPDAPDSKDDISNF